MSVKVVVEISTEQLTALRKLVKSELGFFQQNQHRARRSNPDQHKDYIEAQQTLIEFWEQAFADLGGKGEEKP